MTETVIVVYYSGNPELERFKSDNADVLKGLRVIYAHNTDFGGVRMEVMHVGL
jgi:hypothetical protein